MARLADYFVVVGYDQEKSGKSDGGPSHEAEVCVSRPSVSVMMLLLRSFAPSLLLATRLAEKNGEK